MIAAMLNKHRRLAILLDVYTSWLTEHFRYYIDSVLVEILTDCLYTPEKDYYSELYRNLVGKIARTFVIISSYVHTTLQVKQISKDMQQCILLLCVMGQMLTLRRL